MRVVDLIQLKRDGGELSKEEVEFFLQGFSKGQIADFQASALLMAILFHGLTDQELADWAECAASMATPLDLEGIDGPKVSKHSTGGVGDKTSLIVVALVAAAGIVMPAVAS